MKIYNNTKTKYCINEISIRNLLKNRYCVFDLEATGLDYNNEYIIQIGAVMVENGKVNYDKTYDTYVKSPIDISSKIEKLTSINNDMIRNAPTFREIHESFKSFVGDSILVAQCGFEFDFPLLQSECKRNNLDGFANMMIDTKLLFANLHSKNDNTFSTDYLLDYYGVDKNDVIRHTALGDSILIGRILQKILSEYTLKGICDLDISKSIEIKKFVPQPL